MEETLNAITTIKAADLSKAQMQVALKEPIAKNGPEQEFLIHPLAAWLERTVALQEEGPDRFTRRAPFTFTEITKRLADETGAAAKLCHTRLQELFQWSEQLNKNAILQEKRRSYLPLKIHQFIAQTNTVRVTLDDKQTRKVIFDDALYVNIDGEDRSLFPVLFSRFSGREFLCVELDGEKGVLKTPRPGRYARPGTEGRPQEASEAERQADGHAPIPQGLPRLGGTGRGAALER